MSIKRDSAGRWAPGSSGNPAGRRRGSRTDRLRVDHHFYMESWFYDTLTVALANTIAVGVTVWTLTEMVLSVAYLDLSPSAAIENASESISSFFGSLWGKLSNWRS